MTNDLRSLRYCPACDEWLPSPHVCPYRARPGTRTSKALDAAVLAVLGVVLLAWWALLLYGLVPGGWW